MLIGVPAETTAGETRVAVTPETAKKLKAQGHTLRIQSGAGLAASATDEAYQAVGAEITDAAGAFACELVLKVRNAVDHEVTLMRPGTTVVGMLNPFDAAGLQRLAGAGLTGFALEAAPRTTRAQSMEAAVGVGGYARPMPPSWLERQKAEVAKRVAQADVVITTALIPGRPAPVLVTEDMVRSMKPGSVIVDLAAPQGGNCPLTEPGRTVQKHGVTLVGETNLAALVAADASALYARNVLDFLKLILPQEGGLKIDLEDDIVAACLMTQGGELRRKS
jgi:NAD/NADP transhydrogenase alpha subunit